MGNMSEAKKRDFVSQMVTLLEQNAALLTEKGFDPKNKINELKQQITAAEKAEAKQAEAMAAAMDATKRAQETLITAYQNGSATVDLLSGLLGKKDSLIREIKKMRK